MSSPGSVSRAGAGAPRTFALVSAGGHGEVAGHGSLDGGQLWLCVAGERAATTTGAGVGHDATRAAAAARQRTKKFPSFALSTGLSS